MNQFKNPIKAAKATSPAHDSSKCLTLCLSLIPSLGRSLTRACAKDRGHVGVSDIRHPANGSAGTDSRRSQTNSGTYAGYFAYLQATKIPCGARGRICRCRRRRRHTNYRLRSNASTSCVRRRTFLISMQTAAGM